MHKQGKIFAPLLLLFYVLATVSALIYVNSEFSNNLPSAGGQVGEMQTALLFAYDRAEQKLRYLEAATARALEDAFDQLYADQYSFFLRERGEGVTGLDCATYGYQLWNEEEWCLDKESAEESVLTALAPATLFLLDTQTFAYPGGGFAVPYRLQAERVAGSVRALFHSEELLEEPIFLGLAPTSDPPTVSESMVGLSWPSSGSNYITSCFGERPNIGRSHLHKGIDVPPQGMAIAAADGRVIGDPQRSHDGTVVLEHTPQLRTRYIHLDLSTVTVKEGEVVKRGSVIGKPSDTATTAAHLHFEVIVRELPETATHLYPLAHVPGWAAANPVCFFPESVLQEISYNPNSISCLPQNDPLREWCDEYAFLLSPASSAVRDVAAGALPSSEAPTLPVDAPPQSSSQKVAQTYKRMQEQGWGEHVIAASIKYDIPQSLILGIITQESVGDPHAISSYQGCCVGLMQIKDSTARDQQEFAGEQITPCGTSCRALGDTDCRCSLSNDARFDPERAIMAGAEYLRWLHDRYAGEPEQLRLTIAAYNSGPGNVGKALERAGVQASWERIDRELRGYLRESAYAEVSQYVLLVEEYAVAWNGGVPLDTLHKVAVQGLGDAVPVGTYSYDASFTATVEDRLTPFLESVAWAEETLEACAAAPVPAACLVEAAAAAAYTGCEDPGLTYILDVATSLHDCAANQQQACTCLLPAVPEVVGSYELNLLDFGLNVASDLHFPPLPLPLEVVGAPPESISLLLDPDGSRVQYSFSGQDPVVLDTWAIARDGASLAVTTGQTAACFPVKRQYALCSPDGVKFALTLEDSIAPVMAGLTYDAMSGEVRFSSEAPDLSFYNVQVDGALLQTDASAVAVLPGERVSVSAVDRAGNEGAGLSITIPLP